MKGEKIRIVIADDWEMTRMGLKVALDTAEDIEVVGEVGNAQETPRIVSKLNPDVLLMDLKWFGDETAGSAAIREVRAISPKVKILALTAYEGLIANSRKAGADAAIIKNYTREGLIALIRELAAREKSFPSLVDNPIPSEKLTEREIQVLELLAVGKKDKEIAQTLSIAISTAKNHVKSILGKLGVRNRLEAVNQARKMSLIS